MERISPSGIRVRPPRPADAPQLGALHNAVWRHAYAELLPAEYLRSRDDAVAAERWATVIDELGPDGRTTEGVVAQVADDGHDLVGFVSIGPGRDEDRPTEIELRALYVLPRYHGTGVADDLIRASLGGRPAYLWVLAGNERAIAYYRKLGFQGDGAQKPHPPTGAREIRMVRRQQPRQ